MTKSIKISILWLLTICGFACHSICDVLPMFWGKDMAVAATDGVIFSQMRICHMYAGADVIRFGVYACSPEESSFTAVFTDMKITECMWKAHDGQQPDEE